MTYHSTWQWKGFIQEKKQFKFSVGLTKSFSGIDRCYNKAIKDEGITEDYKILIIVLIKVGGKVAGQRKERKIVHSRLR